MKDSKIQKTKKSSKIKLKIIRSFSIGFTIFSPTLNGFGVELCLGCFHLVFWQKGERWFGFSNYWNG